MFNADRFENSLAKLGSWHLNLMTGKGVSSNSLSSSSTFSSCWPFLESQLGKSQAHVHNSLGYSSNTVPTPSFVNGNAARNITTDSPLSPRSFDEDSNLFWLSTSSSCFSKDFFGDMLLAQYLFRAGKISI